jgi:hypothetical protein
MDESETAVVLNRESVLTRTSNVSARAEFVHRTGAARVTSTLPFVGLTMVGTPGVSTTVVKHQGVPNKLIVPSAVFAATLQKYLVK